MRSVRTARSGAAIALLTAIVLAAACGSDVETERAGPTTAPPPATADLPSDDESGASDPSTPPTSPGDTAVPPGSGSPGAPAPDAPQPSPTSAPPPTSAAVPEPGAVGSFGPWYLGTAGAQTLVLEIRSQSGAEPTAATVDRIRSVLADASGKQISTAGGDVPGGARQWTSAEIRAEADRVGPAQRADAGVVTLLFLRGGLAGSDSTIGVAVRSDVAAVFSDRVDEAAGIFAAPSRIEAAVTTHEVGHLLGLVDLVLATGREDPEHPGHSPNRNSVMYFAVESTLVGDILGGGPPVDFDDADRADLRAIASRSS